MASAKIEDVNIQLTVMAIREELMSYFKDGCVQKLTMNAPVMINPLSTPSRYQYQRQQAQREQPAMLFFNGIPLATLRKSPDKAVLHTSSLSRSPELRAIRKELERFFDRYLVGVKVELQKGGVNYA